MSFLVQSLATALVAVGNYYRATSLFGKSSTGSLAPHAYLLLWPYLVAYRCLIRLHRYTRRYEPVSSRIAPGFFLSGWVDDERHLKDAGCNCVSVAVVDLTCELPRSVFNTTPNTTSTVSLCPFTTRSTAAPASACGPQAPVHYLCVPTFDRLCPSPSSLRASVDWALTQRASGKDVVVHCAFGHGRSATVLLACLLASGVANSVAEGVAMMKRLRPHVELTPDQKVGIELWCKEELPRYKGGVSGSKQGNRSVKAAGGVNGGD